MVALEHEEHIVYPSCSRYGGRLDLPLVQAASVRNGLAKNGPNTTQQVDFYSVQQNTAITDDQENAYTPIAFYMVATSPWTTWNLLPGSGEKITILFAVPKGTNPQDLVVTLKNWNDHKGRYIRVH